MCIHDIARIAVGDGGLEVLRGAACADNGAATRRGVKQGQDHLHHHRGICVCTLPKTCLIRSVIIKGATPSEGAPFLDTL
jgi:hypothetical protein